MNQDLDQRLRQDAQVLKKQAVARLEQHDFSSDIESQLLASQSSHQPASVKIMGLAAAICLTVLAWLTLNDTASVVSVQPAEMVADRNIELNLNQLPQSLEQKLNQPLRQEQQAIIDDLKALKEQLLSI
ncbi:MAG: hypothetical protein ACSHWU_01835 [Marinicella sp.]